MGKEKINTENITPVDLDMTLRELLCHDHAWFNNKGEEPLFREYSWGRLVLFFLTNSSFRFVVLIRVARRLWHAGFKIIASVLRRIIFFFYGAEISQAVTVGPGIRIPHPQGIIIGGHTVLGANVHIAQYCTIGGNFGKKDSDGRSFPVIGDNVMILAGSLVGGPVHVGDGSIIGANCVVVYDVSFSDY